jgi:type I restriction enzyme M protein
LKQYVSKQYIRKDSTVGVELNFNKEFYVPEPIPSVDELLKEIEDIDNQLKTIQL